MKKQVIFCAVIALGLVANCVGDSFKFPESRDESRSFALDDYDDRRLHHHQNQQHHQHHNHKRKKMKKKRRKKPCYYRTPDGRTFFWTGLNIYETNVYVNQGYPAHQGDFSNLGGAGPCESSGSESDVGFPSVGSLQSPQRPQRPNRPVLQGLASYIPSGPSAWQWIQGVHWSNYIPNQNSFEAALNSVVNSLPGIGNYGSYRPPSVPVRPVTEAPTDFTRPPTFTRPPQRPIFTTRPTQRPVFTTRPTQRPVFTTRPTQQTRPTSIFTRPTQPNRPTPSTTSGTGEDGSDENYDYSNFSSENSDNSADPITGLGSATNQPSNLPASNIPTLGSIGNGIKPVYERPGKYFNDYIVKPFRGSITQVVKWFK